MHDLLAASGRRRDQSGAAIALIALAAAFGSTAAGFLFGSRWLLPVLNVLAIYPFYISLVARGRARSALALALLWALFLSQAVIMATYLFPGRAAEVVWRGVEYRDEMFAWVRTGQGMESSPARFIPVHIRDFAIFSVVTFVTGGAAGLIMGAALLNYMNFYVGSLVLAAESPAAAMLLGWQPYAIIRVVAYILVATALSDLLAALLSKRRVPRRVKAYAALGVAGVIIDILVKSAVAPLWSRLVSWAAGV